MNSPPASVALARAACSDTRDSPPAITSAANTNARPKSSTQLSKPNAPLHAETTRRPAARSGPRFLSQNGAPRLSRRVVLGAGLSLWAGSGARSAEDGVWRLSAEPMLGGLTSYGYNGGSPGPLIRARVGEPCRIALANKLGKPTSLALQGLRASTGFDRPVPAGETTEIGFTPREPGFGLYLPYGSPDQLGGGLFGAVVVEADAPAVDLDASAVFSVSDVKGDLRTNAAAAPAEWTAPPGGRVRLRLANAAPDLVLLLKASAPVSVVAVDGEPSEIFTPRGGELPLAPSARYELMFDLPEAGLEFVADGALALRFRPQGARGPARPPIAALAANPRLPVEIALERAQQVRIVASGAADRGFALNGAASPAKPLFKAARGTPVSLTLVNNTREAQTLRLEGHVARVLHAFDDGWDPYWRDTLLIGPGKTIHAAFVADAPGKWPLASASPQRRAKGLAGWFEVA